MMEIRNIMMQWNLVYEKFKSRFKRGVKPVNPLLEPHFNALESRVKGAIQFLKNNFIHQQGDRTALSDLPWFLIIGGPDSGKSAMLHHSNIKFVLDKKNKSENLSSESCDWWVTANTVLVDVPGKFITCKGKKASLANKLWEHFLSLIHTLRGASGLSGVVIAISLKELFDKENYTNFIETLRYRIYELQTKFGKDLPIYFTLTKCDLLPGFTDFFSEYSKEELLQAWGIPLTSNAETSLFESLNTRFNALVKRLNEQVITRLHQERSMHAKYYIKDFPLQLERVKEALFDVIRKLNEKNSYVNLKGIYLTSSLQQEDNVHLNEQREIVLAHQFQQALAIMQAPSKPSQAYFIKQFLLQCLIPRPVQPKNDDKKNRINYMTAAAFGVLFLAYVGHFFIAQNPKPVVVAENKPAVNLSAVTDDKQNAIHS